MSTSSHRTRRAVAAAALAATATLVTAVPAGAGTTGDEQRSISIRGVEPREDRFFIKGRVEPSYENRAATIQRKIGRSGEWSAWKDFRTNDRSRYRERVRALRRVGRVFYRVRIDASDGFRRSFSSVVFIRTSRG